MKGERKLSLVKPPPAEGAGSTDDVTAGGAPAEGLEIDATPEELREAEELRRSLERGDDPTAAALRAAFRPAPIDGGDLEAILARALGDLDASATRIEATEADQLRAALEEHDALRSGRLVPGPGSRNASLQDGATATAIALRAAWAPQPIGAGRNDALVGRALSVAMGQASPNAAVSGAVAKVANDRGAAAGKDASADPPAPISLRRFRMGARTIATMTAVVAMAAGVLLMVGRFGTQSAPAPAAAVAQAPAASANAAPSERAPRIAARSTQEMFDAATPFPRSGGESARVDRIAAARAADLRANRFAAWGVR